MLFTKAGAKVVHAEDYLALRRSVIILTLTVAGTFVNRTPRPVLDRVHVCANITFRVFVLFILLFVYVVVGTRRLSHPSD